MAWKREPGLPAPPSRPMVSGRPGAGAGPSGTSREGESGSTQTEQIEGSGTSGRSRRSRRDVQEGGGRRHPEILGKGGSPPPGVPS